MVSDDRKLRAYAVLVYDGSAYRLYEVNAMTKEDAWLEVWKHNDVDIEWKHAVLDMGEI